MDPSQSGLLQEGVYLCVHFSKNRVGVAWYNTESTELCCFETADDSNKEIIQRAKLYCQPRMIFASAKATDEPTTAILSAPLPTHPHALPYPIRSERSSLFTSSSAIKRLLQIHIQNISSHHANNNNIINNPPTTESERLHALNTVISISSECQIIAAGALLSILDSECLLPPPFILDNDLTNTCLIPLKSLKEVAIEGFLLVDPTSMEALQIFSEEHHASAMGIGSAKEGYSVFSLLNRCVSPAGKKLLRLWFSRPIIDLNMIEDRYDSIQFFMYRDAERGVGRLRRVLRRVKDAGQLLEKSKSQALPEGRDFAGLLDTVAAIMEVRESMMSLVPPEEEETLMMMTSGGGGREIGGEGSLSQQQQQQQPSIHARKRDRYQAESSIISPAMSGSGTTTTTGDQSKKMRNNGNAPSSYQQQTTTTTTLPRCFFKIATTINDDLVACHALISQVVDLDSPEEGMLVARGISPELDQLKHLYNGLPDFLYQVVGAELARVPRHVASALPPESFNQQAWNIVYMPQVGFLLRVGGGGGGGRLCPAVLEYLDDYSFAFEGYENIGGTGVSSFDRSMLNNNGDGGTDEDNNNNNVSSSSFGAYYHCNTTRELNERFGDLLHRIRDMEASILGQLVQEIDARYKASLVTSCEAAAEVDCLLSLALASKELGLTRPRLTRGTELIVKRGRHILTEGIVDTFIPNDTDMFSYNEEEEGREIVGDGGDDNNNNTTTKQQHRVHIITGPNASGKSVYIKQVAIIAFLAHIGCFVPAESACIGMIDRIFTRLTSRETLALPQSTFMIDLSQMAAALRLATSRSLMIIDEFGKGTLSADGVGLLCGCLRSLLTGGHDGESHDGEGERERKGDLLIRPAVTNTTTSLPPRVLLATHFSEVLDESLLPRTPSLAFYTMSVVVSQQQGEDGDDDGDGDGSAAGLGGIKKPPTTTINSRKKKVVQDVTFLYRLVPGKAAPSFGIHCAKLAGVEESVLERACQLLENGITEKSRKEEEGVTNEEEEEEERGGGMPMMTTVASESLIKRTRVFKQLLHRLRNTADEDAAGFGGLLQDVRLAIDEVY
jgi:DNA mismatch repair protein MSH5